MTDHDCRDWNSGGACAICRRALSVAEQLFDDPHARGAFPSDSRKSEGKIGEGRSFAEASEAELLAGLEAEMLLLTASGTVMPIALDPLSALRLAGLLQLCLRHPHLSDTHRDLATELLGVLREAFIPMPAIGELLRRGDDPACDVEAGPEPPRLIVP